MFRSLAFAALVASSVVVTPVSAQDLVATTASPAPSPAPSAATAARRERPRVFVQAFEFHAQLGQTDGDELNSLASIGLTARIVDTETGDVVASVKTDGVVAGDNFCTIAGAVGASLSTHPETPRVSCSHRSLRAPLGLLLPLARDISAQVVQRDATLMPVILDRADGTHETRWTAIDAAGRSYDLDTLRLTGPSLRTLRAGTSLRLSLTRAGAGAGGGPLGFVNRLRSAA
jgi:hypothetical protein